MIHAVRLAEFIPVDQWVVRPTTNGTRIDNTCLVNVYFVHN
jgi:hypothetical protein